MTEYITIDVEEWKHINVVVMSTDAIIEKMIMECEDIEDILSQKGAIRALQEAQRRIRKL